MFSQRWRQWPDQARTSDDGSWADGLDQATRPTFLELFFDLAYVFALIALSERLVDDLSWAGGRPGLLCCSWRSPWSGVHRLGR
ncbi:low temperature requirement protein A [Plantactinospora sp. CA-290183]|uniref:low temperature requirement protein A n=1 Tax=Plantactinospora sp. CA-290183 TaxID=3240006 RepID=UPI003D941B79